MGIVVGVRGGRERGKLADRPELAQRTVVISLERVFLFGGNHGNDNADGGPDGSLNDDVKKFKVKSRPG